MLSIVSESSYSRLSLRLGVGPSVGIVMISESPVAAQQTRYPAGSGPQAPAVRGSEPPPRRGRPPARRGRAFPGRVSDSNFSPGFTPKLEFKSRVGSETAACGL